MRLHKANFAGLTSPGQSEMKSILVGTWPPLKPLPVFKYETAEYRATIDFDRKRGEWVCRKTSLPSNEFQELRGGLIAITMALPHGGEATFTEETEQQEQESEKDTHRRLQAVREWREKYENGARYFELQDFLSESQRTELDDSLRLSLTARQLQFNSKNVANVFDDLSVAGGRFASLIEFAKRNKVKQGTHPQAKGEGAAPEDERMIDNEEQLVGASPLKFEPEPNDNDPLVQDQKAAERSVGGEEFPAVSIKDVFPEQDQPSLAERMAHTESQQSEIETSDIADEDSLSLIEHPHEEGRQSPAFTGLAAQVCTAQSSAERIEGSSSRFPALKISAFQVNVFAMLFLFAVTAFTIGLTVGRGPVGRRLREPPQSLLATDAKPSTLPDPTDESTSGIPTPPLASSDGTQTAKRLDNGTPSEDNSKESSRGSGLEKARSTGSDSCPTTESKPSVKPEVSSERSRAVGPVPRNVSPPASSSFLRLSKAVRPINRPPTSPAPDRLTSAISSAPHLPTPTTVLVTVPGRGSQPFRVSFPNKTIAATSSLAMTSQLSVLVSPRPWSTVAHKSARLEAGELVSFVWPRYSGPRDRYGLAEIIRVRATIGQLGQVTEAKYLGGSASLLPATMEAIHRWRYRPTLLDRRPVKAQQDVTIEFRPPQYSSQVSTLHPPHN